MKDTLHSRAHCVNPRLVRILAIVTILQCQCTRDLDRPRRIRPALDKICIFLCASSWLFQRIWVLKIPCKPVQSVFLQHLLRGPCAEELTQSNLLLRWFWCFFLLFFHSLRKQVVSLGTKWWLVVERMVAHCTNWRLVVG